VQALLSIYLLIISNSISSGIRSRSTAATVEVVVVEEVVYVAALEVEALQQQ